MHVARGVGDGTPGRWDLDGVEGAMGIAITRNGECRATDIQIVGGCLVDIPRLGRLEG